MKKICDVFCFQGIKPISTLVGAIFTELKSIDNISEKDIVYYSPRNNFYKHYFRKFQGYGLSIIVYNILVQKKVTKVILNIQKEKFLLSDFNQWKLSNKWMDEKLDGQIDDQYILKESDMILLKGGTEIEMANIDEFVKASGSFLSAKDVLATPTAVFIITSEGKIVKNEKFGNEKLQLEGEWNKTPKTFDLSKTNARVITEKLGSDTIKWIGKQLILETYRTKTSDGKMTDAINVKEVR